MRMSLACRPSDAAICRAASGSALGIATTERVRHEHGALTERFCVRIADPAAVRCISRAVSGGVTPPARPMWHVPWR